MVKFDSPEHFKKDWLLHFSGFLTWSVITYLSLININDDTEFVLKLIGLCCFYLLFFISVTSTNSTDLLRKRIIVLIQIILILGLIKFGHYNLVEILLVLIATQLPSMFSRRQAMAVIITITVVHFAIEVEDQFIDSFFHVIIYFMLQVFGFSAIESIHREQKAKEELAAINQELLATRFMLKETSQRKERLRISRDLHDVIGHQLTALSLNLEVSYHKVPDEYKPLLKENLKQAKTLLTNVREVVKEMRNEEQFDLITTLTNLVEQLPNCHIKIENEPNIKSLSLKQQLIFCLQEGISNALRHGKATEFILNFQFSDEKLQITLKDNGRSEVDITFGSGLTGMQERLAEFNGEVKLLSSINGHILKIKVEDCYD